MKDIQFGRREGSIISVQTIDSLTKGDRAVWRAIRKELELIGITPNEFEANRDLISDWFKHAANRGAVEERASVNKRVRSKTSSALTPCSPENIPLVAEGEDHTVNTASPKSNPFNDISSFRLGTDVDSCRTSTPSTKAESSKIGDVEEKGRVPRMASLIAAASSPKVRLMKSIKRNDHGRILQIFSRPVTSQLLDKATTNSALVAACPYPCTKPYDPSLTTKRRRRTHF